MHRLLVKKLGWCVCVVGYARGPPPESVECVFPYAQSRAHTYAHTTHTRTHTYTQMQWRRALRSAKSLHTYDTHTHTHTHTHAVAAGFAFGNLAPPVGAPTQPPVVSSGFGFGNLMGQGSSASAAGSSVASPAAPPPVSVCEATTSTVQGLAVWSKTEGVCCWLLAQDDDSAADVLSSATSDVQSSATSPSGGSQRFLGDDSAPIFSRRCLQVLQSALDRRDGILARATVILIGNFLACGGCREKLWPRYDDVGRLLVAARNTFPTDVALGRMLARAFNYLFEQRAMLADKGDVDNAAGKRASTSGRLLRKQPSASSARRSTSPSRQSRALARSGTGSAGADKMAAAVHSARETVEKEENSLSDPSSSASTSPGREPSQLSPSLRSRPERTRSEKLSSDLDMPQTPQTPQTPSLGSGVTGEKHGGGAWNEVEAVVALFELCKANDVALLAWAACALRSCFSIMCDENAEGRYRNWVEAALADRRPALLLKLVNHPSPLVNADAMQCLALITSLPSISVKRSVYLSGVMYSVVSQGMRALPCVTVQAAHVMANLASCPANMENMLEASNPSFKFIRYLTHLGLTPRHITFEFVGLWRDETFDRTFELGRCRLGDISLDAVLQKLTEVVHAIREAGASEGFFALQDFDEFFYSIGPDCNFKRHGKVEDPGRDVPHVSIQDEETTILGTVAVVGYAWQNAVYHIKGITPEVPPPATKVNMNPELAWGPRSAAVYEIAHELDVVPWKEDEVLLRDARNLGIRTLTNMAQCCGSGGVLSALIQVGAYDILLKLCSFEPPLADNTLVWVAHAISELAKSMAKLVIRGQERPVSNESLESLRTAVKRLLASSDDQIQSSAASCLVFLNQIGIAGECDSMPGDPPMGPPSREASGLGRFQSDEFAGSGGSQSPQSSGAKQTAGMVWGSGAAEKPSPHSMGAHNDSVHSHCSVASDSSRRSDSYVGDEGAGHSGSQKRLVPLYARQTSRVFDSNIHQTSNMENAPGGATDGANSAGTLLYFCTAFYFFEQAGDLSALGLLCHATRLWFDTLGYLIGLTLHAST